jgi:hypothetical protein
MQQSNKRDDSMPWRERKISGFILAAFFLGT